MLTDHDDWIRVVQETYSPGPRRHLAFYIAYRIRKGDTPTVPEMATEVGRSDRTVQRYLAEFRRDGLIDWTTNEGPVLPGTRQRASLYTLHVTPSKPSPAQGFSPSGHTSMSPRQDDEEQPPRQAPRGDKRGDTPSPHGLANRLRDWVRGQVKGVTSTTAIGDRRTGLSLEGSMSIRGTGHMKLNAEALDLRGETEAESLAAVAYCYLQPCPGLGTHDGLCPEHAELEGGEMTCRRSS